MKSIKQMCTVRNIKCLQHFSTYNFWAKKTHPGNVLRLKQSIHQTNWAASIAHDNTVNCVQELKKGNLML